MKPEMNINTLEVCPSCNGTGKISSTLLLEDDIEKNISYLVTHKNSNLKLVVHPILYAYLTKGWFWNTRLAKWKKKFGQKTLVMGQIWALDNLGAGKFVNLLGH